MTRLGLRLALRSGREAVVRLILTMSAVAIGVAILLAVLADYHGFQANNRRPFWEGTQGTAVTRQTGPVAGAELWNFSYDIYHGQTIERLDLAALGPKAPVPPGIGRLPASGQYYASPALAALLRSVPRDELGARFPGREAGTIGNQALSGPDELVIYVGYTPAQLAALPGTAQVNHISAAPQPNLWTHYFRYAFAIGVVAFVFPVLIFVGTATRLATARREERYAALRLVGATPRQVSIIASADAVVSAALGTLLGIGLFVLLQPVLARSALTSARYFSGDVTPTALGYLVVLAGVPLAAALAALWSLRRVRISPLGVSRRVTPSAPRAWRVVPLVAGIILFIAGLSRTTRQSISALTYPGLIVILVGLVMAGPWLTAQAARLFGRFVPGPAPLLAARRLADNPKAAFRSVSGLVLAVFLGTVLAGMLPAVQAITATPSARALSTVLMDTFTASPRCGLSVNCTGGGPPSGGGGQAFGPGSGGPLSKAQQTGLAGLPPQAGAALLAQLRQVRGAHVFPVYSQLSNNGVHSVISCASLRKLAALGQCAPGLTQVQADTSNLFSDNPHFSTMPIASPSSPAAPRDVAHLYLQLVFVKVSSPATLERVRTFLDTHTPLSQSGMAPRTFGEATLPREGLVATVERLVYIAVALTLLVAGCSLAVAAGGGLVERKRPFALLRLSGTPLRTLYRVVFAESVFPLAAAIVVAAGIAYGIAVLTVNKLAPGGTPTPVPGAAYYQIMGIGLAASLLVILVTLPLLGRMTGPGSARFE